MRAFFGLFYGISAAYMDGVLSARIPAALITGPQSAGISVRLFSSDGFNSALYRQALLSDFSCQPQKASRTSRPPVSGLTGCSVMRRKITAGSPGLPLMAPRSMTATRKALRAATAVQQAMLMTRLAACLMPTRIRQARKHRGDRDGSHGVPLGDEREEYELVAAESACSAGDPLAGHLLLSALTCSPNIKM